MIKDGASGDFDLLNAVFSRVLILFVGFRLFAAYSISTKKLAHATHKLLLCIVLPDVNSNAMIAEAVLKDFGKFQAWLGSYGIDILEKFIDANNNFNNGSAIVSLHRRKPGVDAVILVFVRTYLWETIVRLFHWDTLIETTKLGGIL